MSRIRQFSTTVDTLRIVDALRHLHGLTPGHTSDPTDQETVAKGWTLQRELEREAEYGGTVDGEPPKHGSNHLGRDEVIDPADVRESIQFFRRVVIPALETAAL